MRTAMSIMVSGQEFTIITDEVNPNRVTAKLARALFDNFDLVRGRVLDWYDGDELTLKSEPATLRRLVVRAIKEMELSSSDYLREGGFRPTFTSYGGTEVGDAVRRNECNCVKCILSRIA